MNPTESLVRRNIRNLVPYSTARDEYKGGIGIFLDANESPYPTGWNRYPDPRQTSLKERISEIKGTGPEHIFLGNGSDEAIDLIFRIFCEPGQDNVVAISPSYGMYGVSAAINDIEVRSVLLNEDFSLPSERLLAACDAHTKVLFICSPNNPSGNAFTNEEIFGILDKFHGIVVVDEAYIDFCSVPSLLASLGSHPNLMVLQTMSKARGLASLRLGMAFASEYIIRLMSMVKYPYNINGSTQKLAMQALAEGIEDEVAEIVSERARVAGALAGIPCVIKVYPSEANFLLVKVTDADAIYGHLLKAGVIVRNRNTAPLCGGCLRITIGFKAENDAMLDSISDWK